jgi:hypothetical protein
MTENITPLEKTNPEHHRASLQNISVSIVILLFLVLTIAAARLASYNEPFERDITIYAVLGHEILLGRRMYSDLWDHKPPGVHYTYMFAEAVAGYGPGAIYLLNVLAAAATLLGVFATGSAAGRGNAAGLWAAVFWTVISGDLILQANQPNTEVFMNALLIWAFFLIVRATGGSMKIPSCAAAGFLFAGTSLYKQTSAVVGLFLISVHFLLLARDKNMRGRAVVESLAMGLPVIAVWGALFAYYKATGHFNDFRADLFTFNSFYSGPNVAKNILWAWGPAGLLLCVKVMKSILLLAALAFAGFMFEKQRFSRAWILLIAFTVAQYVNAAMPGRYFNHYYQLLLPALVVGAAWAVASPERLAGRFTAKTRRALGAAVLVILICYEAPNLFLSADSLSRKKYGETFIDGFRVGKFVDKTLAPGENFFQWGDETSLYYSSRRRLSTSLCYTKPLRVGPLIDSLTPRVLDDLERNSPELFVVYAHPFYALKGPVEKWFHERYVRYPDDPRINRFEIYMLKNGRIASRYSQKIK